MSSFLNLATKRVTDVRSFLRNAAGGNSIKYSIEKGKKHILYIPYQSMQVIDEDSGAEVAVNSIVSIEAHIHEWNTADGKFKSCACMDGIFRKDEAGNVMNDGTCPFCEHVTSAWEIANYRKQVEEDNCKLTGDAREKYLTDKWREFRDEMKMKAERSYLYVLVAQFTLDDHGGFVMGTDNLPEYTLRVWKMSASKVSKIEETSKNAGFDMPGITLVVQYPNVEDLRQCGGQCTITPTMAPTLAPTIQHPSLKDKIDKEVAKFDWEGISKAFPELNGMTTEQAKTMMDNSFEQWDKFQIEKQKNPNARYLEYVVETPKENPALDAGVPQLGGGMGVPMPNVPNIPMPNVQTPNAGQENPMGGFTPVPPTITM